MLPADAGGGFTGAGPLKHWARVVEAVLEHACVIGMTWPRPGQGLVAGAVLELGGVDGIGGHHGFPLGPLRVADLNRDRAAERDAVPDARQHGDLVLLELHPRAAAVAKAAAGQLTRDVIRGDVDSGDHAFDHGHQRAAVGFTSSGPSQHASYLPTTACNDRFVCRFLRSQRNKMHRSRRR